LRIGPTMSSRTIRLKGLELTTSAADFGKIAKSLDDKVGRKISFLSRSPQASKASPSQVSLSALFCSVKEATG